MKSNQKFKKGFGILEVLISAVAMIVILSALVFIGRGAMANSGYVQDRAQALYLAQEGVEIVRQIRDTNWIDSDNETEWNDLVWENANDMGTADSSMDYFIKYDTHKGRSRYLLKNGVGISDQITVNNVVYSRKINIENTGSLLPNNGASTDVSPGVNALKVTVNVGWSNSGVDKSVSASEILTNWRPNF